MERQIAHEIIGRLLIPWRWPGYFFSMEAGRDLFSRHAERMTAEALADTRVVVVNGARQVGKSTLAELIVARSAGGPRR